MSSAREKWDRIYFGEFSGFPEPARVLLDNAHLLPESGHALDLACGLGGNALFLAQRGLDVRAWDISRIALDKLTAWGERSGLSIRCACVDLSCDSLPAADFDVIVVSRFLDRRLAPAIVRALKPGGVLFYQTYVRDKLSESGPSNPDFLLAENELLSLFSALRIRHYREDGKAGDTKIGWRDEALMVGQKPT